MRLGLGRNHRNHAQIEHELPGFIAFVHFAWPPEYPELWEWQWNEVAIPYWKRAAAFAEAHGIKRMAIEMHPGFLVYNPETLLKLREAVGETIGVNLDPSHLFWMGIDVPTAIRKLG